MTQKCNKTKILAVLAYTEGLDLKNNLCALFLSTNAYRDIFLHILFAF